MWLIIICLLWFPIFFTVLSQLVILVMGANKWVLIAFVILSVALLLCLHACRCTKCKGMFTLRYKWTDHIEKQNISMKAETKTYNKVGEVIGTQEQYIPGTRNTYQDCYICKKCGNETYYTYKVDRKNI